MPNSFREVTDWRNWFWHTSLQGTIFGIRLLPQCREQFMIQSKNNEEWRGKTMLTCLDLLRHHRFLVQVTNATALCVWWWRWRNTPRPKDSFMAWGIYLNILHCCPSMSFQESSNYAKVCFVTSWDHQFCINVSMCLSGNVVLVPVLRYCWLHTHSSTWYKQTQTLPKSISQLQNVLKNSINACAVVSHSTC